MPRSELAEVDALVFRQTIRPALIGYIGKLEPVIADLCGEALDIWMRKVITETMAATALHDRNGLVQQELMQNYRVIGRYSLTTLAGTFYAYPWLKIHETGGEIAPVNGQFLAIPIYNALRADGSPKFRDPKSWQRWGSFVYKQKGTGKLFLAYKDAGGTLRILYVLIDKVTIPARLGLKTMAEDMFPLLFATWAEIFVEVIDANQEEIFGIL